MRCVQSSLVRVEVKNGFFVGFSERIIIVGLGEWPPGSAGKHDDKRGDEGGEIEFSIPVRRK